MALQNYVDVQERINRFWQDFPDGAIRTRLDSDPHDFAICRYRAEVYKQRDNQLPDATGYAFEVRQESGKGANVTSHEENCETSAIGRALANMGYAKDGKSRPSRQEMSKVERGPQAPQQPRSALQPANPTPAKGNTITSTEGVVVAQTRHVDAPAPANLDRERVMKALHAAGKEAGLEHVDLHRLIAAKGFDSMSTAPVDALVELGKAVRSEPGKLKQWLAKQQELLPTPDEVPDPIRHTR